MKSMRKLLGASIMLVVALLAVVSSTYAWFTQQNPLTVDNINVSVEESSGIYMSIDGGTTWKTGVTYAELLDATGQNVIGTDGKYAPSCVGVADNALKFDGFKKLNGSAGTMELGNATAGIDYSKITLKFRADSATTLNISTLTAKTAQGGTEGADYAATSMLRMAFIAKNSSGTVSATNFWKQFANTTSGVGVKTDHIVGETEYKSFYNSANPGFASFVNAGFLNADGAIALNPYTGYAALLDTSQNMHVGATLPDAVVKIPAYDSTNATTIATTIMTLEIYIWTEGWDSLCVDDLSGTEYIISFIFAPKAAA